MQTTLEKLSVNEVENKEPLFLTPPLLEISNLSISLHTGKGKIIKPIVKNLSLTIRPGEMLGLAGESGSGKSITASAIISLLPKSLKVTEGSIVLNGKNLLCASEKEFRSLRGKEIAYLFQNYQGSFTPFIKIGKQLIEVIKSHEQLEKEEAKRKALWWLNRVSLPAERIFNSYPFQLCGGQLQRASIAAALLFRPSLIIADEPTTALDVLTGENILDLISELQKEFKTAVLLISHDLKHLLKRSDTLAVMYGGQMVEYGQTKKIRNHPEHPYTKLLFAARPILGEDTPVTLASIPGDPGLISEEGCAFAQRCPLAFNDCFNIPKLTLHDADHQVACHALDEKGEKG
jgi:oligopeptide/dipeptide ABC transporter ATP-binding protein